VLDAAEGFVPPDPPELPLALAHVTEVGSRERTRIVCVYGLSEQLDVAERRLGVADLYPFGRFSPHVLAADELLPSPVLSVREVDLELPGGAQDLGPARAILMVTPRGDAALVLDAEMTGDPDGQQVAHVLDVTCLKRGLLRLDGKTMIEWLRGQADASGLPLPDALALGAHVHQCVFPGGALLAAIRGGATYWRLVYRVAAPREPTEQAGTFRPPELNYNGYVAVGHGRGVSVISGFARPVENVDALMVVMLVTGLGVLHRSRSRLFAAMTQAGTPVTASIGAARTEISELSAQLNELQLDLEFGVESYLDGVLIPEAMVEAYQRSLCEAMGIRAGLEHSSRMLERLSAIIGARRTALDAAVQEQAERRDRLFSGLLAVGTLLALPPTLLLAFFALAPDTRRTIFDPRLHWAAYLIAFLPFIALVAAGWLLRRRIRASSGQLDVFEGARSERAR
jgi:uncharacterized membrane protein YqjE